MAFADATKVNGLVITSSPGPMPFAINARCSAVVPELVATACLTPICDRASPRGDCSLDRTDVEVKRVIVHVNEDRLGSNVEHGVCRRHEGEWTRDHLVARPDAICDQRQVQRSRARAGGDGMPHTDL